MEAVLFYILAGLAAVSAVGCIVFTNVVRMAVCLFGTLGAAAALYFLMGAGFLGAIQLLVYAGGTLVVIIFGVMLTSSSLFQRFLPSRGEVAAGAMFCGLLFAALTALILISPRVGAQAAEAERTVAEFGRELLTTYLVPFEAVSVLLLAVMIGAAYLVRRDRDIPGSGSEQD